MNVQQIIKKIEAIETPPVKKAAIAYSGGLDSSLGVMLLRKKYGAEEIVAITVDVGQGEAEMRTSQEKAKVLGIEPIVIDAKQEFTQEWLRKAIQANSDYNGYPVSTSMTRQLVARDVAQLARDKGCDSIMEGSSGKGNDQYRMHNVFKLFAPELKVLVPVRDFDLTRGEEEQLCKAWGVPVTEGIAGGDDKTMWCRSIASGAVDLNQELPRDIWMWYCSPTEAPDKPARIELKFEGGVPVALNGKEISLEEIITELNLIGGANGVGKIDMCEDGIMDLKSREIYEAPAAHIVLKLHRDLEQFCLTKDEIQFKKMIDAKWAYLVYHGMWFHPLKKALDAFISETQSVVNGAYMVELYKGNIDIIFRESATSLFTPEIRSIKSRGFNQQMCADAAHIRGLPFEILARREGKG
ncbi:MAG: argininosuccinate synthase [bacterium]